MGSNKYTIDQFKEAVKKSRSWRQTAYTLGLNGDGGGNTKTLKQLAKDHNIDFSHFLGKRSNKGQHTWNHIKISDLLQKGKIVKSYVLKKKLLSEKLLEDKCYECGIRKVWNNKPIIVELHHIDGDRYNNLLDNLTFLCPNCHSQTPSFRGRKMKRPR